jgi:hypothetical protein
MTSTLKPQAGTLKQIGRQQFIEALAEYETAARHVASNGRAFIMASLKLHAARGNPGVTRGLLTMARRAERQAIGGN